MDVGRDQAGDCADRQPAWRAETQAIASADALSNGGSVKFRFERDGVRSEGFVVRFEGAVAAYENRCCHLPLTLDYDDNRFFTADGRYLVCQNHGALFEPLTGLCIRGPCVGARLRRLAVEIHGGLILMQNSAGS